ncbi:hypothetical protein ABT039_31500 [Streptomyces lasiicapitis]|uniref:hypothetical protein n=1 Tax=Streptomyces lasiicapitis TaxID=1923961 RepID=UPI003316D946
MKAVRRRKFSHRFSHQFTRRVGALTAAVVAVAAGGVLAGTASAQVEPVGSVGSAAATADAGSQWRNVANGLCMTTADDPANGFQGTATLAPCDAGDPRQRWRLGLDNAFAFQIVSVSNGKCLADVGGWGLAWMATCERRDIQQAWGIPPDSLEGQMFTSWDDGKRLSTPYKAGTSYATVRDDLPVEDARYRWWLIR